MKNSTVIGVAIAGMFFAATSEAQIFRRGNSGGYNQPTYQQPQNYQPQQPVQQGIVQQGIVQQGIVQQGIVQQGIVQQGVVQQGVVQQASVNQHWSQTLLQQKDHDFGAVAKLARTEHVFEFVNPLETDLYLDSVHASCKCTIPTILTPVVKPGETAKILAVFDTRGFDGQRGATVRVQVRKTQPYYESAELLLSVKGMIRRDIVTEPGEFDMGIVRQGNSGSRTLTVKYAGNPAWKIQEVKPSSDKFKVTVVETRRDPGSMRVDYQITVESSIDLPKGDINEQIVLITNDANNPMLSVPVQGRISVGIEASDIRLGKLGQGEKVERKLLVKGESAFAIVAIESDASMIQFDRPDGVYRTVQMVGYKLNTEKPGEFSGTVKMKTTDPSQPEISLAVNADIVPGTFTHEEGEIAADRN